jgi:hypothetical protein
LIRFDEHQQESPGGRLLCAGGLGDLRDPHRVNNSIFRLGRPVVPSAAEHLSV